MGLSFSLMFQVNQKSTFKVFQKYFSVLLALTVIKNIFCHVNIAKSIRCHLLTSFCSDKLIYNNFTNADFHLIVIWTVTIVDNLSPQSLTRTPH